MGRKEKSKSKKQPNSISNSIAIEENEKKEEVVMKDEEENSKDSSKKRKKKKPLRISSILTMVGVVTLGILSGTFVGLWIKGVNADVEPPSLDSSTIEEVNAEKKQVADKWKKAQENGSDFFEVFEPIEMMQISIMKLEEENYIAESFGITNANNMSIQNITSVKAHFSNLYYYENLSFGKAPVIGKMEIGKRYIGTSENIVYYDNSGLTKIGVEQVTGEEVSVYSATYKETKNEMTNEEFEKKFGNPLSSPCDYIISSTTLDLEKDHSKNKNEDGNFVISFSLTDEAATNYKKKIKTTGGGNVKRVNSFDYIDITCTLTEDLRMVEFYVKEHYGTTTIVGSTPCSAFLHSYYFYEGISENDLPKSTENYKFRSEIQQ